MKLFAFPQAALEKAIAKRMLTLPPPHKEWFSDRWSQKPYKKSFIELKAMPLVTFLAKGKSWSDEEFGKELAVIKEERRMRTDDNPRALMYEQQMAATFVASPYRVPVARLADAHAALKNK